LNLMFGYNGLGRLTGNETGSVGGAGGGSQWGATGIARLFNTAFGGQISWLLPAAVLLLTAGLVVTWKRPRTDRTRAALLLWGGWLFITSVLFSFGKGIIHPYYTIALAPAVGAVVGIGAVTLWSRRGVLARLVLAAVFAVTVAWSYALLARTPSWHPWIRVALAIGGFFVVVAMVAWPFLPRRSAPMVAIAAVAIALLGPGAYTVATAATPHRGAIPSAGPASASRSGPGGLARGGFGPGGARGTPPAGAFRGGAPGGAGFAPGGALGGGAGLPTAGAGAFGGAPTGGGGRGLGGLLNGSTVSAQLKTTLNTDHARYRWVAATVNANTAGSYQLATGSPVMAVGGFNGTDPSPTLAQFQQYVSNGEIHYFITGGTGGGAGPGGQTGSTSTQITTWVANHFTAKTVGGVTIYDLSKAPS
jgi:4-amino-4-deoxy-L-arabinose transferase-like glycosyltransferase